MDSTKFDFGMIGLGVMGRNFALNVADHDFSVVGLDRDAEKAAALESESSHEHVKGTTSTTEFVESLATPRKIMLLVPAGKIVDAVIADLLPLLQPGDLIMDGGNSYFADTDRRIAELNEHGLMYFGVGVSGGAEGARRGPSIMPGGNREAYESARPILEAVAAKVGSDPCVDFMGHGSAGHYVKMVHNGIEYALMQLIAESYDILKRVGGLDNQQMRAAFESYNRGQLQSFLIEITAQIFAQTDDLSDGDLIDKILDKAKQKGTGKWTSQHAMDLGVPTPTIDAAVTMRGISSLKAQRSFADDYFGLETGAAASVIADNQQPLVDEVGRALLFGFIVSYAQGLALLSEASREKEFELNLEACGRIWRGGCIIRAALLEDIRHAFAEQPELNNLLVAPIFRDRIIDGQAACRNLIKTAIDRGVPAMTFSSALHYFDAYRSGRLPLNLVQAQRDFFGSHTYQRTDRDGSFHTQWATEEINAD